MRRISAANGAKRVAFVVAALLMLCAAAGAAEEPKTVQSLGSLAIDTWTAGAGAADPGAKVFDVAPGSKGSASVVTVGADPKTYVLIYVAPKVQAATSDTLTYILEGKKHEVAIQVTPESAPTLASGGLYNVSFKVLFVLFIVAVILESALAVIFNWRPFLQLFDARGVRTIISLAFAYVFVDHFNLDVMTQLINVYTGGHAETDLPGKFITALVIAGGSSGVNNLMVALGFRAVKTEQQLAPKPPPTQAWISVRLLRKDAKGMVDVLITPAGGLPQVAGSIAGSSSQWALLRYFLRDWGRFPGYGGHVVAPGQAIEVKLAGRKADGTPITSIVWGPYALAAGALVDVELAV